MRHLILALLVSPLPGIPVTGAEPLALIQTMDGFRKEIPPPRTLGARNGFTLKDVEGKDFTLSHLTGVARRLGVKSKDEALVLLVYLKDPDPKIRFIAVQAIEKVVHVFPGGMSVHDIVKIDSGGHRALVRRCVEKVALADPAPPEPGPENGGLRLRLMAAPSPDDGGKNGFKVRLEVLNVTRR